MLKGLVDNVLSDIIWGHAIVISSATMATVGLGLTIPIAMLADMYMTGGLPPTHLAVGSLLVITGFLVTTLYTEVDGKAEVAQPEGEAVVAPLDPL